MRFNDVTPMDEAGVASCSRTGRAPSSFTGAASRNDGRLWLPSTDGARPSAVGRRRNFRGWPPETLVDRVIGQLLPSPILLAARRRSAR